METKLSEQEIKDIAKEVAIITSTQKGYEIISSEFDKRIKKMAFSLLDRSFIEAEIKNDSLLLVEAALGRFFKNGHIIEDRVKSEINQYFSSETFKRISIQQLKRRIEAIEREIEREYEED